MDESNNTNNNIKGSGVSTGGLLVETTRADKAVWLMKCPALVSHSLNNPSSDDLSRPIAKVILSIDPLNSSDDNSSRQFTMELADNESGNTPKSYSMDMSEDFIPMSVFSESSQGKISVEGKILFKFDMRPHNENLENYAKICRERTKKYMTKGRQIQVIDNDNGSHMRPMPLMITSGSSEKKKPPPKATDTKRTRRDRGEMEDIMFKLFERQSNWTLRQLIQETDQPEQFLKDILKELCVYNNKGTNQGSYQLKPEYKRTCEESGPK
ncbi:general transcription factor IIF subunit 2 [Manihot esculenta]|uniref:Uncharacterized protein n=1 Tax=Manihot esculenta TaxID=3983 RepID=A0ACB7HZS7_MANES|nr:general transcription factor IIF subunit 2 [Manihot esculenta]KAG8657479.1 hypothetical protein MANES_03G070720v8 [Manihot esculenta]